LGAYTASRPETGFLISSGFDSCTLVRVLTSQLMQWTSLALLLGLTGCGLLLLKIGGEWYFDHRGGTARSVGAAATLIGLTLLCTELPVSR